MPQAIAAMKQVGGRIQYVTKHDLNLVIDNKPHQVRSTPLHRHTVLILASYKQTCWHAPYIKTSDVFRTVACSSA